MVKTLALKRRTFVERKVLTLLRGACITAQSGGTVRLNRSRMASGPSPQQAQHFSELRRLAARSGYTILPPSTRYVGDDELRLLSWLAGAQRIAGTDPLPEDDPALAAALHLCAGLLDDMGLRLSPLTLYSSRFRDGGRFDRRLPRARCA